MADTGSASAPYAAPSALIAALRRFRERGVPSKITREQLSQIGLAEQETYRVLVALQFLGLVDEDGTTSSLFHSLRAAPTDDYAGVLADILNAAYEKVFQVIDPATANDIQMMDAFRPFTPGSQTGKMVKMFRGLAQEANIIEGEPKIVRRARASASGDAKAGANATRKSKAATPTLATPPEPNKARLDGLSPMMRGFFETLPDQGTPMTPEARQSFATIFKTMLDVDYPPDLKEGTN